MIDKIKNWLIIILIAFVAFYYISNSVKDFKLDKLTDKLNEAESKIDNLEKRIKADVAANKHKAELEKKMSNSKDIDNLNHVPDVNILNQLRSSPV